MAPTTIPIIDVNEMNFNTLSFMICDLCNSLSAERSALCDLKFEICDFIQQEPGFKVHPFGEKPDHFSETTVIP